MSDLVDDVLAACDRWGGQSGLSSARRSRSRIETLTYGQLGSRIRSTARGLQNLGLAPGDRVLFSVRPGPDAVVLALGILLAAGVVVFGDPGAGETLFRARAALAAPRWVAAESLLHLASTPLLRPLARRRGLDLPRYATLVPAARHLFAGPWLPGVPRGAVSIRGLSAARSAPTGRGLSAARSAVYRNPPSSDPGRGFDTRPEGATQPAEGAEALVVFTSGTTGNPRAVVHARASLAAGLGDIAAQLAPGQRVLTDQLMVGIPALLAGAHWIMPPPGLDPAARPAAYLPLLRNADVLFAVPAAMDAILRALPDDDPAAPSTIVLGGAPVLRPLLERIHSRFPGAAIRAVYGMTEILPVAIADGAAKLARPAADGDWVGALQPSVRARIDDGELVLSGLGLAQYLGEEPHVELRTGDLARLDADGVTLLGRRKDMFIRGTQNVYPGLIEPVIAGLPGVRDVLLTGAPDVIGDDRLVLLIVPDEAPRHPDPDHPVGRAVARALPGLVDAGVIPDLVVAVPDLPRSGRSSKPDRAAAARLAAELLAEAGR